MKTIFRYTNISLLVAAIFAVGAIGNFAQDPCGDAVGLTAMDAEVREKLKNKTKDGRKAFVLVSKQFVEKYGSCEPAKELATWLQGQIPANEKRIKEMELQEKEDALVKRFNGALVAKSWDEVFAAGKDVLAHDNEKFRTVELVLGSIGYDELFKGNNKYNDETLRYAKIALASLESGKPFSSYGLNPFTYKNKDDAIAWMNLTIGYITQVGTKNKVAASPYLFKATQAPDTAKNPIPYELIGGFYFDELNKLVDEIQKLAADQKDTDTPEVAQQKIDMIKAKVALSNGTAERAMDAFSRAYTLGQAPAYKAKMKKNVEDAYKVRFAKTEGVDAWISTAVAKPFANPMTPVTPISDPEPVKTATTATPGSGIGAANGAGVGAANGTGVGKGNGTGLGAGNGTGVVPATTPAKATAPAPKTTKPAKAGVAKKQK